MMRCWRFTVLLVGYPIKPMRKVSRQELFYYMAWLDGRFGPLPHLN